MANLIKDTASRRFLKEATGLRIGSEATERLVALLEEMAGQIATKAKAEAVADARNTLLDRDLDVAFESFLSEGAPSLLSAQTLHRAIQQLPTDTFIELTQLLRADLKEDL